MAGLVPFNRKKTDLMSTGFNGFNDFRSLIDDFFADTWPIYKGLAGSSFKVDVQEKPEEYIVEAELPGVDKEDVSVTLNDGRLIIAVNKEESSEEKNKSFIHRERSYTSVSRTLLLPDALADGIKAKLKNGVLTLNIPRTSLSEQSVVIDIE